MVEGGAAPSMLTISICCPTCCSPILLLLLFDSPNEAIYQSIIMPTTTYHVEKAKSGRSGCKKCKDKIEKDAIRIGAFLLSTDREMKSYVSLAFVRGSML